MLSSLFVTRHVPSAVSSILLKKASGGEGEDTVVAIQLGCDMLTAVVKIYVKELCSSLVSCVQTIPAHRVKLRHYLMLIRIAKW